MKALGLSDAQKELVESVTAAEVLKFSMLNSMDAVRLLVVNEFKKNIKFFNDQAVIYNVVAGPGGTARVSQPQSTPFSNAKAVSPYEIYLQGRSYMIIGPETSGDGVSVTIPVPGRGGLPLSNVTPGKIYITGRDSDGEPMPIQDGLKNLFLKVSTLGRAMRATSMNPQLARVAGIDPERVLRATWVIGGVLAAVAGVFAGLTVQLRPTLGLDLLLPLFAAVILGGIGSVGGAVLGGLIVGLAESASVHIVGAEYRAAAAFAVLIAILLVKPNGLFGEPQEGR
jgi:hypothetical protein